MLMCLVSLVDFALTAFSSDKVAKGGFLTCLFQSHFFYIERLTPHLVQVPWNSLPNMRWELQYLIMWVWLQLGASGDESLNWVSLKGLWKPLHPMLEVVTPATVRRNGEEVSHPLSHRAWRVHPDVALIFSYTWTGGGCENNTGQRATMAFPATPLGDWMTRKTQNALVNSSCRLNHKLIFKQTHRTFASWV